MSALENTRVLVAGAGMAGLSAARALEQQGASVTVVEARDRIGGRVWTIRDAFKHGQYAEGGADLIEAEQEPTLDLARELGLHPTRVIGKSFGFYGPDRRGRPTIQSIASGAKEMKALLADPMREYELSEERWDGAIARRLAGQSVADWLDKTNAPAWIRARLRGLRGLFLADPEDLSLLALVEFFSSAGTPGIGEMFRVKEGNDRLASELGRRLRAKPILQTAVRRVHQRSDRVVVTLESRSGLATMDAEFVVMTLPASTLRDVVFEPELPPQQHDAIARLRYGPATRLLVQFGRRFWKRAGRPLAFGTDLPTGAVWDANERQKGGAGILSFLAGGNASHELQAILRDEGLEGLTARLEWLGNPSTSLRARPAPILSSRLIVWDDDPWVRGGYAVFDPGFDPLLRDWLARPAGRIVFAGEHTSHRYQGYIAGAIESGRRAAAEVRSLLQ